MQDELEFPAEVVDVLDAAVGAAGAEGRDLVRGVAEEEDAAVAKALHSAAAKAVDGDPFELEFSLGAEHGAQAREDALGALLLLFVDVGAELEVDAPDVVGLFVQ